MSEEERSVPAFERARIAENNPSKSKQLLATSSDKLVVRNAHNV